MKISAILMISSIFNGMLVPAVASPRHASKIQKLVSSTSQSDITTTFNR